MSLDSPLEQSPPAPATLVAVGNSEAGARESVTELTREPAFQQVAALFRQYIAAAGNGHGAPGIARVLHQYTGRTVIVEDPTSQVIASSGAEQWSRATDRHSLGPLPEKASHAVATREGERWVAVASPRGDVLCAVSLIDPDEQASEMDLFALEQAATVLGWEMLHVRNIAEAEVALWGDFATELLEDADIERIRAHGARLGYDLDQLHRALLVLAPTPPPGELREVVGRATSRLGVKSLTAIRPNGVVLIVAEDLRWAELATVLGAECDTNVRLGVGGRYRLEEIKKSLADAEFALTLKGSPVDKPLAVYDELGVWRLLARPDASDLQELVDHWIGPLIDYDRDHHSELLKTLVAYLEEFGALEATAAKLFVHRNSLRYRLVRIGELTGWDLNDPEQRFHLDLACRAFLVRQALAGSYPTLSGLSGPADTNGNGVAKGSRLLARRPEPERGAFAAKNTRSRPRRPGLT